MYVAAVILAAGKGTRMKSRFPKVTHAVGGRPMLEHVLRAASEAIVPESDDTPASGDAEDHSSPRFVVVVGHERETVRERVQWSPPQGGLTYIEQEPQLGTGDAVRAARAAWRSEPSPDTILVLYGDTPLVRAETLRTLLQEHAGSGATLTFLTGITDRPGEYGRVVRDAAGQVRGIVEKRHATGEQLAIPEVNSGIYCIAAAWLWSRLERLEPHENGEYYLTDLVEVAVHEGQPIATTSVALEETIGVNDRVQLAEAERLLRERTLRELMLSGVTVEDPATTYVECGVRVGQDTILRPGTRLLGCTVIGERCEIGPQSVVRDSEIGDDCLVLASWVEEAHMAARSRVGPFSHLRPGARLESGAHVGNFGEVKNATIGAGVQMHHFSYIGDANVGAGTNIGAGVVTVNYDGQQKHHTEIGERAFIGSDTMLRAPVTVSDEAATGAGSVVTHDVPRGTLVAGVPARQVRRVRSVSPDARPDHPPERETRTAESSPGPGIQSEDVGWGEGE
jgi:bifunctional UDP-N-acetylglucosamine pyrophosphorylase / glucosamine-1-phosphate N-acetyltransferase